MTTELDELEAFLEEFEQEQSALEAEQQQEEAPEKTVSSADADLEVELEAEIEAELEAEIEAEEEQKPEPEPEPVVEVEKPKAAKRVETKAEGEAKEEKVCTQLGVSNSVQPIIDPEQLNRDLAINDLDLQTAFMEQASLYSHYAFKASQAARQADRFKQLLDITSAKIDKEVRDLAADEGRKLTEAVVSRDISLDSRFIAATKRYNDAKMIARLATDAQEAFKQRRDMLIQSGAFQREELKGQLRMNEAREGLSAKADRLAAKMAEAS